MADNNKKSFHVQVAEKLIEQLQQGIAPWQKPWKNGEVVSIIPFNPVTNKRYKGSNAIYLMCHGRSDPRWMTYKQAAATDAQVRKGETGTLIQYWKFNDQVNKTDENGNPLKNNEGKIIKVTVALERPRIFYATVFNAEQIEGLPPLAPTVQTEAEEWQAIERAEHILTLSGAVIHHGEQKGAFYRPTTDSIHLPDKSQFLSPAHYYATVLHELGHWTGHTSRLDRDLAHPFGSMGYAKEELRAEIASLILGNELQIGHDPDQHVAYVASWIKVLRDEPLELFRAAADAEKIQEYVLGLENQLAKNQEIENSNYLSSEEMLMYTLENSPPMFDPDEYTRDEDYRRNENTYLAIPSEKVDEAKEYGARWNEKYQLWFLPAGEDSAGYLQNEFYSSTDPDEVSIKQRLINNERVYLIVPYIERQDAKAAGAKWDKVRKSWYVLEDISIEKIKRWLPENVSNQQMPALSPREEFSEMLKSMGCLLSEGHPIMDGNKHRITVVGDKMGEQAGFYVGHLDGHPAGYIKNNRTGVEVKWKSKGYFLSSEQKTQLQAEAADKLHARAVEEKRIHKQSAQRVVQQVRELLPITQPTPYLITKSITPQPGIFTDDLGQKTYIPIIDENGKQWSIQTINEDGSKRFAKNSRKEGCFHVIGGLESLDKVPVLVIAEGYATAATLSETLGYSTVTAFDAGNLVHVAKVLHEKFPDKTILIAGDNDQHVEATQGVNPGKLKAEEAARLVGGKTIFPIFAPGEQRDNPKEFTDFNDLFTKSVLGKDSLIGQIQAVIKNIVNKEHQNILKERKQTKSRVMSHM